MEAAIQTTVLLRDQLTKAGQAAPVLKSKDDKESWEALFDHILAKNLPKINKEIRSAIKDAKMDPWKDVASDEYTLGKINLGICTAKAKASYNVTDMKGLSSLEITSAVVEKINMDRPDAIAGTISLIASFDDDLTTKAGGKVSGKCGVVHESVGISGKAKVKGVTARATSKFSASIGTKACINSCTIDSFSVSYSSITVDIDGLGIFNKLLHELEKAVESLLRDTITGTASKELKPIVNGVLKDAFPICQDIPL